MTQILLVDDSSVIRKVARRICETSNLQTSEAENGLLALESCAASMPDAILLDDNMPVMDGFEFLKNLRRLPGGRTPKVLLCTTENDPDHVSRALHAGAHGFIMKPFDRTILQAKLQSIGVR